MPHTPHTSRIPDNTRLFIIGDLHGRDDLLLALFQKLSPFMADTKTRQILVYLGDFVDRGGNTKGLLDLIIQHPFFGFERVALMGNHEFALLQFLEHPTSKTGRTYATGGFGSAALFASYGLTPPHAGLSDTDLAACATHLRETMPESHLSFLLNLKFSYTCGDYHCVHAGIRPGVPLDQQSPSDLLWIRDGFLDSQHDHGKVIIHGHTISDAPVVKPNRIGIDTGAYRTDILTCLVLEQDRRVFIDTAMD